MVMDIEGLLACQRCGRSFAPDDLVVMAVPFREHEGRFLMGDELLVHEGCEPLLPGLREVGRGRYDEILHGDPHVAAGGA
jgi:hypothetical protein